MESKQKTRKLTVQGWMGRTVVVTVRGGTLQEAKRTAVRVAGADPEMLPGRRTVVAVEVVR